MIFNLITRLPTPIQQCQPVPHESPTVDRDAVSSVRFLSVVFDHIGELRETQKLHLASTISINSSSCSTWAQKCINLYLCGCFNGFLGTVHCWKPLSCISPEWMMHSAPVSGSLPKSPFLPWPTSSKLGS